MKEPNDLEIRSKALEFLDTCNLEETSVKSMRQYLEEYFGTNLTSRKSLLKEVLHQFVEKKIADGSPDEDDDDSISNINSNSDETLEITSEKSRRPSKRSNGGFSQPVQLSTALGKFMGCIGCARTAVVKKLWDHIKEHNLQNPNNRREILCDATLEDIFKRKKLTMFNMNKFLAPMMKKLDDLQEESAEEDGPKSKGTKNVEEKKSKKRSRKSVSSSSTAEKTIDSSDPIPAKRPKVDRSHVKNPFTKELNLSDDLAKFIGKTQESRCQVVSKLWSYIKENHLQNPSDKREIIFDSTLQSIFKVEKTTMFKINTLLKEHLSSV